MRPLLLLLACAVSTPALAQAQSADEVLIMRRQLAPPNGDIQGPAPTPTPAQQTPHADSANGITRRRHALPTCAWESTRTPRRSESTVSVSAALRAATLPKTAPPFPGAKSAAIGTFRLSTARLPSRGDIASNNVFTTRAIAIFIQEK